jgi:hypothetical protein
MSGMNPGKRDQIVALLRDGKSYKEIAAQVGCSRSVISYHAKQIGLAKPRAKHDWAEIQAYYDVGHGQRECIRHFGLDHGTWDKARKTGRIITQDRRLSVDELTRPGRGTRRSHLKGRLIRAGVLRPACYECGLTEWRGRPLTLVLDHINGVNDDNNPINLRLLCPNCNSQTDTFSGRNIVKKRLAPHKE